MCGQSLFTVKDATVEFSITQLPEVVYSKDGGTHHRAGYNLILVITISINKANCGVNCTKSLSEETGTRLEAFQLISSGSVHPSCSHLVLFVLVYACCDLNIRNAPWYSAKSL